MRVDGWDLFLLIACGFSWGAVFGYWLKGKVDC